MHHVLESFCRIVLEWRDSLLILELLLGWGCGGGISWVVKNLEVGIISNNGDKGVENVCKVWVSVW